LLASSGILLADAWDWEFIVGGVSFTENSNNYSIDFTTLPSQTVITSSAYSADGVTFETQDSFNNFGNPSTADQSEWAAGLTNSQTGDYPTTEFLDIFFTNGASNVSFTLDNAGYESSGSGQPNYTVHYGSGPSQNVVLDSSYCCGYGNVSVSGSDVTEIQVANHSQATAPEPGTLMLLGVGLLGLWGVQRRKLLAL
jgi:hypothetical protein